MREIQTKELITGMLIGAVISLFLVWRIRYYIPGELIPLPPIFAPYFNA